MRRSEITHSTLPASGIVARPPFGRPPFDPNEPLPVSRRRVCIGLLLLIGSFAVGVGTALFPAAKVWLFAACVLLLICSFLVLGLHGLRLLSAGRDPAKTVWTPAQLTNR